MNVLVVPTNRPDELHRFLDAWSPWPWDRVIIVFDGPQVPAALAERWRGDDRLLLESWADVDRHVCPPSVISRGDSAIRSYGFWRAWCAGAEVVFTLDDDCYPSTTPSDFVAAHLHNLHATPAWSSTVPGLRVRGLPYRNVGVLSGVAVSMGLWLGQADLDSVQSLAHARTGEDLVAGTPTRVMPSRQYFPLSGMNVAFTREVACLMYFAPMGMEQPYRRFDDIWCGLVVQKVCAHLGRSIICGEPFVVHQRASDPFVNLAKEAPGIGANEGMWAVVDAVELRGSEPLECMTEMGEALSLDTDGYVRRWGRAITDWCALFTPEA
jgi:reversibly glycosylated polypeptide / UDP-arabinopyranose mutase